MARASSPGSATDRAVTSPPSPPVEAETAVVSYAEAGYQPMTSADALFERVNGRTVQWGPLHYSVEVYAVTDEPDSRWVQVGLHGDLERMVMLRLPPGGDESSVIHALWTTLAELASPAILT